MKITIDKDLRGHFGPARDQDPRPTCMAFAASDAHASVRPGWKPLSVEWAYYHALERDRAKPHDGVTLRAMLDTVREDGQPIESAWPYINSNFPNTATYAPPPTTMPIYRRDSITVKATTDDIIAYLNQDRPVLSIMSISHSFFYVSSTGVVAANEPVEHHRLHALVAVGHGHSATERFVLIRNSWGEGWALNGYAWLAIPYIQPRLIASAVLTKEA